MLYNPKALAKGAVTDGGDSNGLSSCVLLSGQIKDETSVHTDSKEAAHFAILTCRR